MADHSNGRVFTREILEEFTRHLVEQFAPEKVILLDSLARGDARQDPDADILVLIPCESRRFAKSRDIRRACKPGIRVDLLIRRPGDIQPRYRWGAPIIREVLDRGEVLDG
jgi:predicted nucleotidyltransferase